MDFENLPSKSASAVMHVTSSEAYLALLILTASAFAQNWLPSLGF